uniref:Kinesin motor domain-containing protein n=1 Tax=Emiliania huxleyi TaxID=2903 RepID=A0A7S3SNX6_EMIHU
MGRGSNPQMGETSISVVARFRPARPGASVDGDVRFGDDGLSVETAASSHTFDGVLPPHASQEETYAQVSPIVEAVLQGYNGTVLAYGQTGSGKTHSVTGTARDPGILQRAVRHIFEWIRSDAGAATHRLTCSYLEIYKENVRDLLEPSDASLSVRESGKRGVFVDGLSQAQVTKEEEVLRCLETGGSSRRVGATQMNAQSSRSHALLTLTLERKGADGSVRVSRLNVADLAGSEKVSRTGAAGETLEEAKGINASLSALSMVISALADGKAHSPSL